MKPKYNTSKLRTANLGSTLVTVITVCFGSSAFALDNLWTGSLGTDWNNGGNWSDPHGFGSPHVPQSGGAHPGDEDAIINSITPGAYPVVVASPSANPRDVKIGVGAGQSGRVDHTAGTVSTGAGNWFAVGLDGGNGTYNLADVAGSGGTLTGMGQSAGGINANGSLYVPITGGSTGTFNMHTTGTVAVSNLFAVGDGGAGTFKMDSGTMTVGGEFWVGQGGSGNGAFSVSAGQITINSWVAVGRDGGVGLVNMTGGTITKNNGGTAFIVGASGAGGGTFNQSAGTVNVAAGDTWIGENGKGVYNLSGTGELSGTVVQVGRNGSATDSVLNLGGGTFRASRLIGGGASNDSVVFNGSQIIAKTNEAAFIDAIDIATINAGGLNLDSNGRTLASTQIFDGPGGIVKSGAGTFTLTGAQLYDGTTAINAGTMVNGSSAIVRGDFTVADGATLGVLTALSGEQLIVNNAAFATTAAGATVNFDLGNFPGNSALEALKVNGNLVMNGNVTINVSDQLPATGIIPLVKYTPANRSGAGEFVIGNLPLGVDADLIDDEINGVVYLDVQSVALPRWVGNVNGNWDFATQNWLDLVALTASNYTDPAPALFDDNATGTTDVILNTTVAPSKVTFANTDNLTGPAPLGKNYTLTGSGKITGSGSLVKEGAGALSIATVNDYTGTTTLGGGAVTLATLADGGVASSIGASGASPANLLFGGSAVTYTGASVMIDRGFHHYRDGRFSQHGE